MSIRLKVLIADDEALAREGVRLMAQQMADVQIVGECDNGLDAVEAIAALRPDLVLLDIQMPGLNGLDVVAGVGAARMPLVLSRSCRDALYERLQNGAEQTLRWR